MTMTYDRETRATYESDFARLFDKECKNWDQNSEYNKMFIKMQESWANEILAARGHLFLNDLYDALGFPRIPSGQLIGWFRADARTVKLRMTKNENGSVLIEPNVTNSDVMYYKI